MTPTEAIDAVSQGKLVNCTKEEYPAVRVALQNQAGTWIDWGDGVRAMIALREVERLDTLHDIAPGAMSAPD